jgi:hypothetical protein
MFAAAAVAISASAAAPVATWLDTTHDFGAFDEDMGKVTSEFRVVNTGDAPLLIISARASCGCTVPNYTNQAIQPGDTASVKVTYDPTGRPGKFNKKVKVETNAEPSQYILTINGVVIGATNTLRSRFPVEVGPLKLRTDALPFGEILKGRIKTAFLEGYNQSSDTIHPSITNLPAGIKADIAPRAVPPGEQVTFTLFYDTSRGNDWGLTTSDVNVLPNPGYATPQKVSLIAIINEDFTGLSKSQLEKAPRIALSTTAINLGVVESSAPITQEITIDNYGKNPLILRKVSCPDEAVTLKVGKDKIKGGSQGKITVTVDPSKCSGGMLNTRITIISNDPDRPTSIVRVTAEQIK